MKVNTRVVLRDLEGNALQHGDKNLTLAIAVSQALSTAKECDPVMAFILAGKFHENAELELRAEDVVFVKEQMKKSAYYPIVVGQVSQILDGELIIKEDIMFQDENTVEETTPVEESTASVDETVAPEAQEGAEAPESAE